MKGREVVALMLVAVLVSTQHLGPVECQLSATYYAATCPTAAQIVRDAVGAAMNSSGIVGPSVLRLFAHDCFVQGCDASILLQDAPGLPPVERDASDEMSLQPLSFDTINQAKAAVEAQCPGVVSCADILALSAMDVVNMMGGPSWTVLLGRKDGYNSTATSVPGHLPGSGMDVTQLMGIFTEIGLSYKELVSLTGAHTVGFAHCDEFVDRIYDFNNVTGAVDPSLNANYTTTLTALCPNGTYSNTTVQALDPITAGTFDNAFFQDLQAGKGLLFSDQVLFVDNRTTSFVATYATNQQQFFTDFITSMVAMSQVGVLTGTRGEIRLNCSVVNGPNSVPGNSTTPPGNSTTPPANATTPPSNATTPPSNTTTPLSNSTAPVPAPTPAVIPPVAPVLPPSPPAPAVVPSAAPVVIPAPAPVVTPAIAPVVPLPPAPAVIAPPVLTPSPAAGVIPSPPPSVVIPASPPPAVVPSPPPAVVLPSPPPPLVNPSPPPVVIPSPPAPVVTLSPPPAAIVTPSPPPLAKVIPSPPPPARDALPPTGGGRRRL